MVNTQRKLSERDDIMMLDLTESEFRAIYWGSRSIHCSKFSIYTIGDLIKKTKEELLSYSRVDESILNSIENKLHKNGFSLSEQTKKVG